MIQPKTILVAIPAYDGKVLAELAGSLIASAGAFGAVSIKSEVSLVPLVRNIIAHQFIKSPFEWLVCIDSDIGFTPQDFRFLMEARNQNHLSRQEPEPTRVLISGGDISPLANPPRVKGEEADVLVTAEYAYKTDLCEPCRMGLGFTRIHKSVFEKLAQLKHEDGASRLWEYRMKGEMYRDYYPCGPFLSQLLPTGDWKGEDHGFFTLCALAGIAPRIETRTSLVHFGRKGYPYYPNGEFNPNAETGIGFIGEGAA